MDLTLEEVNELLLGYPNMTALEIYQNSVNNATEIYNQISKDMPPPVQKVSVVQAGKIDRTNIGFTMEGNTGMMVIVGNTTFADATDLDYLGGEEGLPDFFGVNDNED